MDSALAVRESASSLGVVSSVDVAGQQSVAVLAPVDLVHAYAVMDRDSYQQLVGVVTTQLRVTERAVSLQCGALRVSTGSSLASGSMSGSSVVAGSRKNGGMTKMASIRKAASWRRKAVPQGLCYTQLLRDSALPSVAESLGQWPTLASLLKTSAAAFKSLDELRSFRLSGDECAAHVSCGGAGTSLLPSFARVAQGLKLSPGTLGAVLRASAIAPDPSALRVGARTPVGGSGARGFVAEPGHALMGAPSSCFSGGDGGEGWYSGPMVLAPPLAELDPSRAFSKVSVQFSLSSGAAPGVEDLLRKVAFEVRCVPSACQVVWGHSAAYAVFAFERQGYADDLLSFVRKGNMEIAWSGFRIVVGHYWRACAGVVRAQDSRYSSDCVHVSSFRYSFPNEFALRYFVASASDDLAPRLFGPSHRLDLAADLPGSLDGVATLYSPDPAGSVRATASLFQMLRGASSLQRLPGAGA